MISWQAISSGNRISDPSSIEEMATAVRMASGSKERGSGRVVIPMTTLREIRGAEGVSINTEGEEAGGLTNPDMELTQRRREGRGLSGNMERKDPKRRGRRSRPPKVLLNLMNPQNASDAKKLVTIRWSVPMIRFATNARILGIWRLSVGVHLVKR
jgi:hypothetical protein